MIVIAHNPAMTDTGDFFVVAAVTGDPAVPDNSGTGCSVVVVEIMRSVVTCGVRIAVIRGVAVSSTNPESGSRVYP